MNQAGGGPLLQDEILEQAALLTWWADHGGHAGTELIEAIKGFDPRTVLTIARGSSDRAADYGKYLLEILLGIPAGSTSPSTVTLFGAKPRGDRVLALAVSQSGESPDIVSEARALRDGGALVVAITNRTDSPLAQAAHEVIDLAVGPELAVAATKSFTAQCAALADIAFGWAGMRADRHAVAEAANRLVQDRVVDAATHLLEEASARAGFLVCIGRGPSSPIAGEGALKIMETTGMPALAYSAADFQHGPRALIRPGLPVVLVPPTGAAAGSMDALAADLVSHGATVVAVSGATCAHTTISASSGEPLMDPIIQVIPLQRIALGMSLARGADPDQPNELSKVTRTI